MRRLLLGSCLLLGACGGDGRNIYLNSGSLCITPEAGKLRAVVTLADCLSSSCHQLEAAACTLREIEGALILTSRITTKPRDGAACTDDCGTWRGACETPEPPPGDYTLVFGRMRAPLTLPLSMPSTLLPDGGVVGCPAP